LRGRHPSPTPLAAPSLHRPDNPQTYFFNGIEPTPAVQPWRRAPLLIPRCGPCSVQYEGRRGGGRSQISDAAPSPQSSNLRVTSQLPFHIATAGPEDDAGGAAGLELGETFAQLLASAGEGHLFGGGYVDERAMAVRNVEGMTAVNREVADFFIRAFD